MWAAEIAAEVKPTEPETESRLRGLLGIRDPKIASEVFWAMENARVPMERFDTDIARAVREHRLHALCMRGLLDAHYKSWDGLPETRKAIEDRYRLGTMPAELDVQRFRDCLDVHE
jgi:hypothetical protein